MQQKDLRWAALLMGRVVSYALLGGLSAVIIGAICIGAAGALTGAIASTPGQFPGHELVWIGLNIGVGLGGITGISIFAITGVRSARRPSFLPPRLLLQSVGQGQIMATFGVCSSFFALEFALSQVKNQPFYQSVSEHLFWIMFGAPAVMICGAIAGAIWGFQREKEASDS